MIRSLLNLFARPAGQVYSLYDTVVGAARSRDWYLGGEIPDTLDGRFRVLSTLLALAILRLEEGGEEAVRSSVHLTEAFIADMDAQMREEGFGDPSLGKQVRSLVGALASRVDRWRPLARDGELAGGDALDAAIAFSLHGDGEVGETARMLAAENLRRWVETLASADDRALIAGHWSGSEQGV